MIDPDDHVIDISMIDDTLDRLLAGDAPAPDAPAWCSDVAVLVRAVRAPAQPDELAGEDEIVRRMAEVLAAVAPAAPAPDSDRAATLLDADLAAALLDSDPDAAAADTAAADSAPDAGPALTRLAASLLGTGFDPAATVLGADPEPTVARLRPHRGGDPTSTGADVDARPPAGDPAPDTAAPGDARAAGHRPHPAEDRLYRAKHAAARLEASPHPVVRTFGRVIAVKAVAATTAAVLAVAAAAATTGIVATVVVPALNDIARKPPSVRVTVDHSDEPAPSPDGPTSRADQSSSPACATVPACDRTTPTTLPGSAAATTVPTTSAATAPADDTTTAESTTTTVDPTTDSTLSATSTTEPEPTTTTTTTGPPGTLGVGAQSGPDVGAAHRKSGGRGQV